MNNEIERCFELRDTPESSRESYRRRVLAFLQFIQSQNKTAENITTTDIQDYILYLKKQKLLAPGTINNYISSIRFYCVHVLGQDWESDKIPRMKRRTQLPVVPAREDIIALLDAVVRGSHHEATSFFWSIENFAQDKFRPNCHPLITVGPLVTQNFRLSPLRTVPMFFGIFWRPGYQWPRYCGHLRG